jgi:hypothetical protein
VIARTLRVAVAGLILRAGLCFAGDVPATTDNVVILAQHSVNLGYQSQLISGQIAVNDPGGLLTVRPRVKALQDTEILADTVAFKAGTSNKPEVFDIFANSLVGASHATINGTLSPLGSAWPLFAFPSPPQVTLGTDPCPNGTGRRSGCVVRREDGPVTLGPGNYGRITVTHYGVLYLQGGVFNVKSLHVNRSSHLFASGTTTINVQRNATFAHFSTFLPAEVTLNPRCIVLNVAGRAVSIGAATIEAVINAPNAVVRLGVATRYFGAAVYTGNLTAKKVRVGAYALLQAADPVSTCP